MIEYGNTQKPACTEVLERENENYVPMAALTSLISRYDTV
jgi:hypothetical protein